MERVYTFVFPAGAGPAIEAADITLDNTGDAMFIDAWQTGGASNLYLIGATSGETLTMDQAFTKLNALADVLCVIPAGSSARRRLPPDVARLTVFAESAVGAGQSQAATVRVFSE